VDCAYSSVIILVIGIIGITIFDLERKSLKSRILILSILFASFTVNAGNELAVTELSPDLLPVYESLVADSESTELVGKRLNLVLNLKFASEKYLLFSDTQIIVDDETKYYLIKWKFNADDVKEILGKSGVECTIQGTIIEVIKGPTSPGMPYVVAELESVEL
jgi:hypothetical protein